MARLTHCGMGEAWHRSCFVFFGGGLWVRDVGLRGMDTNQPNTLSFPQIKSRTYIKRPRDAAYAQGCVHRRRAHRPPSSSSRRGRAPLQLRLRRRLGWLGLLPPHGMAREQPGGRGRPELGRHRRRHRLEAEPPAAAGPASAATAPTDGQPRDSGRCSAAAAAPWCGGVACSPCGACDDGRRALPSRVEPVARGGDVPVVWGGGMALNREGRSIQST